VVLCALSWLKPLTSSPDTTGHADLHATLTGRPQEVTVETIRPCKLNFVSREDFLPFLKNHNDASLQVAQHVCRDYRDACDVIRAVGSHTISERLAKFLLESSAEGQIADGVVRTKLALTHEDIAQLVGASRETVTRTLAEFRKMQILELKGSTLTIHNKAALGRLVAA
jgi:CRP/FNR family cyclic AMP-dependent transcriptional regulator